MQCPICNNTDNRLKLHCKDHSLTKENFDLFECDTCHLIFTVPMPSFENIAPYYNFPNYISHTDIKKGLMNHLYHKVRNYTVKIKTSWIQSLFSNYKGTLLEIGAGTGTFANAMHNKGWKITALEPDEGSRNIAQSNYDLKLSPISDIYNLPVNEYDAITLWHVLEHVHDLKGYFGLFKSILKPNGRLIIAVPNCESYDAQYYKEFWAAYDVPRHLYHFTPQSMHVICANYGFEIVQYKPMWFDSYYVSLLSEKYKNSGVLGTIRAFIIGSISNLIALFNHKKSSSIIYEIKIIN